MQKLIMYFSLMLVMSGILLKTQASEGIMDYSEQRTDVDEVKESVKYWILENEQ